MYPFTSEHSALACKILNSRLTRPTTLDVVIFDSAQGRKRFKLEDFCARFIGSFGIRDDDSICLYLACRKGPEDPILYVYIFTINNEHSVVQPQDIIMLSPYLPSISTINRGFEIGVINIRSSMHKATYLSTLIEVVDYCIGPDLIEKYVPYQVIDTDTRDMVLGPIDRDNLPYCDGNPNDIVILHFAQLARLNNIRFTYYQPGDIIEDPQIVLVKSRGHLIGCLVFKEDRNIIFVVSHKNQFRNDEHYQELKDLVSSWSNYEIEEFFCTRLYPQRPMRCDDSVFFGAIALATMAYPHVLTVIQENEIAHVLPGFDMRNPEFMQSRIGRWLPDFTRIVPSCRWTEFGSPRCSQESEASQVQLIFNSQNMHPRAICAASPTPSVYVEGLSKARSETLFWKEISSERKRIKDSIIPPVHCIEAYTDLTNSYLKLLPTYEVALKFMGQIWCQRVRTLVTSIIHMHTRETDAPDEAKRFVIYPLVNDIGDDCLVIVDTLYMEWVYLHPDNRAYKEAKYFTEFVKETVGSMIPYLRSYIGRPVYISSVFHFEYPRVHLLMSLYVISRLFVYSVELPKKVIYGEWEFRRYSSNICNELQVVNSDYNLKGGLVDPDGYLKYGAKESLPSPLEIETSVVPKDLCMFCLKRGFKNLGRHMAMAHGGQAHAANSSRFR